MVDIKAQDAADLYGEPELAKPSLTTPTVNVQVDLTDDMERRLDSLRADTGAFGLLLVAAGQVVYESGGHRELHVICAAGAWSRGLGAMVGVDLPVEPLRRQILTTAPMPGLDPHTPFTIDFTTSFYFHGEGEGLLVGMSDPHETTGFKLTESDGWLAGLGEAIERRAPAISEVGLCAGWAGLYEMTPDHNALVGEAEGVSRFLYATGFSGHGFLMGPAIGEVMRDLYLGRPPVVDVSPLTVDRFAGSELRPELNIV